MRTFVDDLLFGLRSLGRSPAFATGAALLLVLGIGANCAVFRLVHSILLRPLPFNDADRLVAIWQRNAAGEERQVAPESFAVLSGQSAIFQAVTAFVAGPEIGFDVQLREGSERVRGSIVESNFFAVLGVEPLLGRTFQLGEDGEPVVALSHAGWQRRFGGDPAVVGQPLRLNGRVYNVVGVLPPGFRFPDQSELWVPGPFTASRALGLADPTSFYLQVIGRLRPGVSPLRARQTLNALGDQMGGLFAGHGATAVPLQQDLVRGVRKTLFSLAGAVALVLTVTCANLAGLLLVRGLARQRELAVCVALGADRGRILRQLAAGNLALAALGGTGGLLVSGWGVRLLQVVLPAGSFSETPTAFGRLELVFALALTAGTALFVSLGQWVPVAGAGVREVLGNAAPAASGARRITRWQGALVMVEIALTLVLLAGAGLLLRSVLHLVRTELGFQPAPVLTVKVALTGERYRGAPARIRFLQEALERVRALAPAVSAGTTDSLPLVGGGFETLFLLDGAPGRGEIPSARCLAVAGDYWTTLRIPLRAGRLLIASDRSGAPDVALVDEGFARTFFPPSAAVGRRLFVQGRWREVVGLVGSVQLEPLGSAAVPIVYLPYEQAPFTFPDQYLVVRAGDRPERMIPAVREAVRAVDRDLPVEIQTLSGRLAGSIVRERTALELLSGFAGISLLLAALGLYGVMACFVTQRRREIGIRIALGARSRDVVGLLVRRGLRWTLAGVILGLGAAAAGTRLLASLLHGVGALDPPTLLAASLAIIGISLLAILAPARGAVRGGLSSLRSL